MYGQGDGRIDLVVKHCGKYRGDDVSSFAMMVYAPAMVLALGALTAAGALAVAHGPWRALALAAAALIALLVLERLVAGVRVVLRFRNPNTLIFIPTHLLHDIT